MKLIVFFNGWSSDNLFKFKELSENYDVVNIKYPYSLNKRVLENYEDIIFVSWSIGVYYLNKFLNENDEFKRYKSVAINGNPLIIGNYGINLNIYRNTLKNLNDNNLKKFYCNMGCNHLNVNTKNIEFLCNELEDLLNNYKELPNCIGLYIIGKYDRVIPYRRQFKYCIENGTDYIVLDIPHYIFDNIDIIWRYI